MVKIKCVPCTDNILRELTESTKYLHTDLNSKMCFYALIV